MLSELSQSVKDKYDLTYKCNLINKTNKGEKYNQRHGNKEQTDSDHRGGRKEITGKKRKGHQGTCIKDPDPWTKPKGDRIEGGRWGWVGRGKVVVGKWRQLYLNNNKSNCSTEVFFQIKEAVLNLF